MIIGGGLVGVELLGELTAFVDGVVPLYKHVDRDDVRFVLLQAADRIMPEIDPTLGTYGYNVLAARPGVKFRTNTRVQAYRRRTSFTWQMNRSPQIRSSWRRGLRRTRC